MAAISKCEDPWYCEDDHKADPFTVLALVWVVVVAVLVVEVLGRITGY